MDNSRPYIICHMMSTIEGKITSGDGVDILEDYFSLYQKTEDVLRTKAWMVGRVTMEMFAESKDTPLPSATINIDRSDFIAPLKGDHFLFAVDTKGLLRWKENSVTFGNVKEKLHLVVIITNKTPKEYLSYLQGKGISYLVSGEEEINFSLLFKKIREKCNVEKLVVEGGGLLNGSVMAAGFIDEISLLVCPIVLNRTLAPSVFERKLNEEIATKKYKLLAVKQMEQDSVWLRYQKV